MAKEEQKKTTAVVKKKVKKNVLQGQCHISAGFGNVIVTFTDPVGNTVSWSSAGHLGFKGSRKGTPFAAQVTAEDAAKINKRLVVSAFKAAFSEQLPKNFIECLIIINRW